MLDDSGDDLAPLDDRLHLLWNGLFLVITFFDAWQADVDRAGLARDDLDRVDALLGQVDLTRVGVVDLDGWDLSQDLDRKRGRGSDTQPGNNGS